MKTERTALLRSRKRQWELVSWNLSVKKANETDWLNDFFSVAKSTKADCCARATLSLSLQGVIMKKEQVKKYKSQRVDPTGNTDALFLALKPRCETLSLYSLYLHYHHCRALTEQQQQQQQQSKTIKMNWSDWGEREQSLLYSKEKSILVIKYVQQSLQQRQRKWQSDNRAFIGVLMNYHAVS